MPVLAELIGPSVPIVVEDAQEVWVRNDKNALLREDGTWDFELSGSLNLNTYFGSFPLWKWREETILSSLQLLVTGQGDFELIVEGWSAEGDVTVVTRADLMLTLDLPRSIELPQVSKINKSVDYLVVRLFCNGIAGRISRVQIATNDKPARDMRLGVSITTFNRQQYLIRNLEMLVAAIDSRKDLQNRIQVTVVDNGRNVELPSSISDRINLVPNKNLGGAGGFARGLMMYREQNQVTHVLFMDDDITLCPESIFRAMAFLAFAKADDACIAGAMFEEEHPSVQFEVGAQWKPLQVNPFLGLQRGLRLDNWRVLRESEDLERGITYGAWWFYMFPVNVIEDLPLPVFVRGDDVTFGVRGAGAGTTTLHGVGVWHQAFMYKNGPFHYFLEARNLPLVSLLASDKYKARHLHKRTLRIALRFLFLMRYSTAEAFIAGTKEFLKGPEYWLNIDHEDRLQYARQFTGESVGQLGPELDNFQLPAIDTRRAGYIPTVMERPKKSFIRRAQRAISRSQFLKKSIYVLTLGGHLIPKPLSRLGVRTVSSDDQIPWGNFLREKVVYRWAPTREGYVVTRDRKRFFKLFFRLLGVLIVIRFKTKSLTKKYRDAYPQMTSASYWEKQFDLENLEWQK